jgi:adenylate kinase
MKKRVILVTGTPATGKTTLAKPLAAALNAQYFNLTDLARKEHLTTSKDEQRDTDVIDETKMRQKLKTLITKAQNDVVIDGHYAAAVVPKTRVTNVFVLRRNPKELRHAMEQRGYSPAKQDENLQAEILDVCLIESFQKQKKETVCELDATAKTPDQILTEALEVLNGKKPCVTGFVDWIGALEREGKLDEYLKT